MLLSYEDSMLRAHRNDDPHIMMMCSSTFALSRTFAAGDTQMCSHISTGSHRSRDSAEQNNTARSCKRRLRWRRQGRSGRQDFVGRLEDRLCKQRLRLLGHYLFRFRSTRPGQPRTSSRKVETHPSKRCKHHHGDGPASWTIFRLTSGNQSVAIQAHSAQRLLYP